MGSVTKSPERQGVNGTNSHESWKWSGVLGAREIATSSDLLRRLERDKGLSPANARQALARDFTTSNGIWRSEELRLEGGGRLYAYKSFYGDAPFLDAIRPVLEGKRRGVARVLAAIEKLSAIDVATISKLTAVEMRKDGKPLERELTVVQEAGLGEIESGGTGRDRLVRTKFANTSEGEKLGFQLLAEIETERRWVTLLLRHLSCHNLVSWTSHETRYSPIFNRRLFSAAGYSYVRPLVRFNKGKHSPIACPVVIDVLARPSEVFDVEGFLERIFRAGANSQAGLRILGIIGAPNFSPEAFTLARSKGLVVINFREIFGDSTLQLLNTAQSLFREMEIAGHNESNPIGVSKLAIELSNSVSKLKDHPLVTALSGLAFEAFAAAVVRSEGYEEVRSGEKVPLIINGHETLREVDVNGHIGDKWWVVECKALNEKKALEAADVKYFFTETVPALLKHKDRNNVSECRAELWTTGVVTEEVRDYLKREIKMPRGVAGSICARCEIVVPKNLRPLGRILKVLAAL